MDEVLEYLKASGIEYTLYNHPAAFTVEEAKKYCNHIPGMHCKNLFMRDHKGKRHFLIILPNEKSIDLRSFSKSLNDRLSFASPKRMMKYLGVEPGSVSIFALINDKDSEVELYIDSEVYGSELVTFHPNDNKATLCIEKEQFHRYIESLKQKINVIKF